MTWTAEQFRNTFVKNFARYRDLDWRQNAALNGFDDVASHARGTGSPIEHFYTHARTFCDAPPPGLVGGADETALPVPDTMYGRLARVVPRLVQLHAGNRKVDYNAIRAALEREGLSRKEAQETVQRAEYLAGGNPVVVASQIGEWILDEARRLLEHRAPPEGIDELASQIHALATKPGAHCWCSLIYVYWLDEAGVPWALERLADRIENGVVPTTRWLHALHVEDNSDLIDVISKFTSMWQRGDFPAVDERRRQYLALYGFPLLAAEGWGTLETVDPRHAFPGAFHRFLCEAMRYFRDGRNREIQPDPEPVRAALASLYEALAEGNENLRRRRPPQLRGHLEYAKRLLGGVTPPSPSEPPDPAPNPLETQLEADWRSAIPGRPGSRKLGDPYGTLVDSVASMYQWTRPSTREYLALAEAGELILVIVRAVGTIRSHQFSASDAACTIGLLEEPIKRYVAAFQSVARVDLTSQPVARPPSDAMRRHIQPPPVSPLGRNWATEVRITG